MKHHIKRMRRLFWINIRDVLQTSEGRNETEAHQEWNPDARWVRCWKQVAEHFNWTIIIHDRHPDQVNMSSLTRRRGARIYCTRLGSISNQPCSQQSCASPDGGASAVQWSLSPNPEKDPLRVHRCYEMLLTSLCGFWMSVMNVVKMRRRSKKL